MLPTARTNTGKGHTRKRTPIISALWSWDVVPFVFGLFTVFLLTEAIEKDGGI